MVRAPRRTPWHPNHPAAQRALVVAAIMPRLSGPTAGLRSEHLAEGLGREHAVGPGAEVGGACLLDAGGGRRRDTPEAQPELPEQHLALALRLALRLPLALRVADNLGLRGVLSFQAGHR
jgi:hypothetical protein